MSKLAFPTRFLGALLLLISLCAAAPTWAQNNMAAQQIALKRVDQALGRVVRKAKTVTGNSNYGFMEGGCVFGVMLAPGASVSETFALKAGGSYVFGGGGDDTTKNVDIFISDGAGRVLKKDTGADSAPFILFEPKKSGTYKMTLRLTSAKSGKAFCAVAVLREGGVKVPVERIVQAEAKVGAAIGIVLALAQGGQFNQDSNTWALYGVVLRSKQQARSDTKRYAARNRAFIATGDQNIKDLDLHLLDGQNRVVASDTQAADFPGVAYQTKAANYSIAVANNYSTGPALVMGILIDLPAGFDLEAAAKKLEAQMKGQTTATRPQAGASPFAGRWSGDWLDQGNRQEGTFEMSVAPNGALNGQIYNATVNVETPSRGALGADGTLVFNYSYAGVNYQARGRLKPDEDGDLVGVMTFYNNGQAFGSAGFALSKE